MMYICDLACTIVIVANAIYPLEKEIHTLTFVNATALK